MNMPVTAQGCPHRYHPDCGGDGVDLCDAPGDREGVACILDVGHGPCPIFREIIEDWKREYLPEGVWTEQVWAPEDYIRMEEES